MKTKIKIKRRVFYPLTILLIFFMTIILLVFYNKKSNKSILVLARQSFKQNIYNALNDTVQKTVSNDLKDILRITQNKDGEILFVDYDLKNTYSYLEEATYAIKNKLNKTKGFTLKVPFLAGSHIALLTNFGPDITIRVNYVNSILTNIYTKITNYGLNNALVEAYIKITIEGLIMTPILEEKTVVTYDMLISSKIINGKVPGIYGDYITSNSSLFDVPIE